MEEGELKGKLEEARDSAIRQLTRRFGDAPDSVVEKLGRVETLAGLREFEDEIDNSNSLIEVESAVDNILLSRAINK